MNSLSWFLYLIDVFNDLDGTMFTFMVVSVISGILCLCVYAGSHIHDHTTSETEDEKSEEWGTSFFRTLAPISTWIFIASFLATVLIPSEKTMYMILGSEAAGEVVQSETGKRVQEAINQRLDEYLDKAEELTQ